MSHDGTVIVSGSIDKTIRLWRTADGAQLRTLKRHTDTAFSVAMGPGGATIVSGSWNKAVLVWHGRRCATAHAQGTH